MQDTKTTESIRSAIRNYILDQFPAAAKRGVQDDDSLLTQGLVDSMGALELVGFIESEFELTITDDELLSDHFESIATMADLVESKLKTRESTWIS